MIQNAQVDIAVQAHRLRGEKKLQLEVLRDALIIYQTYAFAPEHNGDGSLFQETKIWFEAIDWNGPFSFQTICDSLDLDANYIRRCIHQWHRHKQQSANRSIQ